MKELSKLEGVWPVMPTPYLENGDVDYIAVKKFTKWYADAGCNGVLVSGSGGEFPYLLPEERSAIVRNAVEAANGRIPIMCGLGAVGAKDASRQAWDAMRAGTSFVLAAMLTYYPVSIDSAMDYYRKVIDASDGHVLYYHYPQTTGFDPGPEGVARICDLDGIVGAKMSRPNLREMRKSIENIARRPFALFSGTILLMREVMDLGGAGAIGIIPSVLPEESVSWYRALKNGDKSASKNAARTIKNAIGLLGGFSAPSSIQKPGLWVISRLPFTVSLGESSRHAVVKEALRLRGLPIRSDVRSPLPQLTQDGANKVAELLKRLKIT